MTKLEAEIRQMLRVEMEIEEKLKEVFKGREFEITYLRMDELLEAINDYKHKRAEEGLKKFQEILGKQSD